MQEGSTLTASKGLSQIASICDSQEMVVNILQWMLKCLTGKNGPLRYADSDWQTLLLTLRSQVVSVYSAYGLSAPACLLAGGASVAAACTQGSAVIQAAGEAVQPSVV